MGPLAMLAFIMGATVQVNLAPDQPIPHVYVDDPLVVEMLSDADTAVGVDMNIVPDFAPSPTSVSIPSTPLHAGAAYWHTVEGAPAQRGRYQVQANLHVRDGEPATITSVFCRIDRPVTDYALPLNMAGFEQFAPDCALALQQIALRSVLIAANTPNALNTLKSAMAANFTVLVELDVTASAVEATALCEQLMKDKDAQLSGWVIKADASPTNLLAIIKVLRQAGSRAPVWAVVDGAETLSKLLAAGAGSAVEAILYRYSWPGPSELGAVRDTLWRAGHEGLPIYVHFQHPHSAQSGVGPALELVLLSCYANGAEQTLLDVGLVYESTFAPGYCHLAALAQRMRNASFVGPLEAEDAYFLVFTQHEGWLVAGWADTAHTVQIEIESADDLELFDGRNNPLEVPPVAEGLLTLTVGPEPVFLTGRAGPVLAQAAQTAARREAQLLTKHAAFDVLPGDITDMVKNLASGGAFSRLQFFNLLKVFPWLEELWHNGSEPPSAVVPTLARLSSITRALCLLEQERGEPFVEPLQNTLANCGQFQSLYLTSSASSTQMRERPDWLLGELTRLTTEAERLNTEGRTIEACAVAAFAEWRGRALDIASRARTIPAATSKPSDEADAKDEEEKTEEPKKKSSKKKSSKNKKR